MKLPAKKLQKILSLSLVVILVIISLQALLITPANAGTMTPSKVTISNSARAASSVTYTFNQTLTVDTAIKQIDIYFCQESAATGDCTAPVGMNTGTPTLNSSNIDGSDITAAKIAAANNTIRVGVGTTAAAQDPLTLQMEFTGLTNSTVGDTSYYVRMTTYSDAGVTTIDTGRAAIGILGTGSISVTANVAPAFSFTVASVGTGATVNNAGVTVTTTATTIPFGDIEPGGSSAIAAHDLTVSTNAEGGYTVTVVGTNPPLADGSNNIDNFNQPNSAPTTWGTGPGGVAKNVNSGFFGYTTEDAVLGTGTVDRFTSGGGNKWAGFDTTAYEVMYNAGATAFAGQTVRVGYQVQANGYQPPGSYAGTITLVATPTY
jgi:hypothetical protein